jgi:hypothetical protein
VNPTPRSNGLAGSLFSELDLSIMAPQRGRSGVNLAELAREARGLVERIMARNEAIEQKAGGDGVEETKSATPAPQSDNEGVFW